MPLIKCSRCGKDNLPEARFCAYCGSRLATESTISPEQVESIKEEIRQLRAMVSDVVNRLNALENRIRVPPEPESRPVSQVVPPRPEPEAITTAARVTPSPADLVSPPEETTFETREESLPHKEREWEQIFGGNWLARIGVLALIIGIGFFLKYAFDNNWIGPSARVILGSVAGLIMLWLGYYWRQRYPIMTQVLSGGGIAVLYLSVFASFATYHLVSIYIAILLLLVISIIATVLALRYNSMTLAVLGILGAFFAPFILGAFGERGDTNPTSGQAIQLLAYLIVVDIGVLILSVFRNWRWFTLLALICSLVTYGFWYIEFHQRIGVNTSEIGITAIFLSFVGATSLFYIIQRRVPQAFDYLLMTLTAAAYAVISLRLMRNEFPGWMGGFMLLLTIFYGVLAYISHKRIADNTRLTAFSTAIALVFLTVAIPMQFGNRAPTTVAWSAEGAVLLWLAFRENIKYFRYESYIVFFLVAIRLIGFDTWRYHGDLQPIFNARFLVFIISIGTMWLASYLLWRKREELWRPDHLIFIVVADFFTIWLIGTEVISYSFREMTTAHSLSLLILLIPAATITLNHLIWRREPSKIDIVLSAFNAMAFIVINAFIWQNMKAWVGLAFIMPAIICGTLTYYTLRKKAEYSSLQSTSIVITLLFLTIAIPMQFRGHAPTTIVWAIEIVALFWISFRLKTPLLRYCGYTIFAIMFWKMLIFDTRIDMNSFRPVINARFLAYIFGIATSYLTVYILRRERDAVTSEWRIAAPVMLIAASFFTLWLVSFEVWQSFSSSINASSISAREGIRNAQNLSLTAVWAIYAVAGLIIGIWRKWRYIRIGSLILLVIPIIKVFTYDVFHLKTSYRIGAFIGLGILLLLSAYLYQRYSKVIKGVFTNK
jgi:uncharacterized membrane protein